MLTGIRSNKLYKLNLKVEEPTSQASVITSSDDNSSMSDFSHEPGEQVTLWHQRYGHVHNAMIIHMDNHETLKGMKLINHELSTQPCIGCVLGKHARQRIPKKRMTSKVDKPGTFFHSDVCGPMSQESYGGARYFVLFNDSHLGCRIVCCMKNKSEVFDRFKALLQLALRKTSNKIVKLRTDRGGEYEHGNFI